MNLNNIIFTDNLPKLDLHGFDRQTARVAIDDFINDNIKMNNEFLVIVHGIGSGVLKNITQDTLKQNINVLEYKINPFNVGSTIVNINLTK